MAVTQARLEKLVAFVLAGGRGARLGALTELRAKPVLPIGLRRRLIDFTLSNCAQYGVDRVAVLVQHQRRSVEEHVARAAAADGGIAGLRLSMHAPGDGGRAGGYAGTADAVFRNFGPCEAVEADTCLVLAGDHVYEMDYAAMVENHRASAADVTIAVTRVPLAEASRFGIVQLGTDRQIVGFDEKPARPTGTLASMGIYAFHAARLAELLAADASDATSAHDFGIDVIPAAIAAGMRVRAFEFGGYWRDVGTIEAYWSTNMDALSGAVPDPRRSAMPRESESLLDRDCMVLGRVERSLISRNAVVQPTAVVRDSIVLDGARVEAGAVVDRAIVDEKAIIGPGALVGCGPVESPNAELPRSLWSGIVVVGGRACIPAGLVVPRNVIIGPDVGAELSDLHHLRPGATVTAAGRCAVAAPGAPSRHRDSQGSIWAVRSVEESREV